MKTLLRRPGFGSFLFAQAQVAFNHNANKLTVIGCVDPPTVLLATPTFLRQYLKRMHITGDLVSIDEEGFFFLEGRSSSRFSKIGGEMISHAAVEQAIASALPSAGIRDCVIDAPCADKGQELVLLTTGSLSCEALRRAMVNHGVPNLWVPRAIIHVDQLPVLASGKLDLASCLKLAEGAPAAP